MKRIALFLVTLLLIVTSAAAQTGKNIYQKYSDSPGVSAVYISPAMFRLIGRIPDIQIRGDNYDFAPVIKSLSGLYLLTSKNIPVSTKIITEVNRLVATDNYELLMEAKDNDETVRMYTSGTESIVHGLIMLSVEGPETTFICLDGKMNREELETLLLKNMKK
ncbi:MAG: DUF4252 domain-containing protein [Bacteroidales bacterium]|nr:DUF4252 domain-containing protein [Bacteroidales bacterium]